MEAMMALASIDGSNPQDAQNLFMSVGTLAAAFIVGTAGIVSLLGILYMTMVVAPNATQRISGALRERNIASFFAGIPVLGLFGLTTAIVHKSQALVAVNGLVFGVVLILAFAAAAGHRRRLYWARGAPGVVPRLGLAGPAFGACSRAGLVPDPPTSASRAWPRSSRARRKLGADEGHRIPRVRQSRTMNHGGGPPP